VGVIWGGRRGGKEGGVRTGGQKANFRGVLRNRPQQNTEEGDIQFVEAREKVSRNIALRKGERDKKEKRGGHRRFQLDDLLLNRVSNPKTSFQSGETGPEERRSSFP